MGRMRVDLFCEDSAHEQLASVLVKRLARELGILLDLSTVSGRGGKARALGEFEAYQRTIEGGSLGRTSPDLLVVIVDANCARWHEVRSQIEASVSEKVFPSVVIGCPEPHVERWCIADPVSFA